VVRWSPTDRAYFLRVRPEMQTARQAEVRNAAGAGQSEEDIRRTTVTVRQLSVVAALSAAVVRWQR